MQGFTFLLLFPAERDLVSPFLNFLLFILFVFYLLSFGFIYIFRLISFLSVTSLMGIVAGTNPI